MLETLDPFPASADLRLHSQQREVRKRTKSAARYLKKSHKDKEKCRFNFISYYVQRTATISADLAVVLVYDMFVLLLCS